MQRKQLTAEPIIHKRREGEVVLALGETIAVACKQIRVTDQTYYRWRKEYGGFEANQGTRLKELERENARLKRLEPDAVVGSFL